MKNKKEAQRKRRILGWGGFDSEVWIYLWEYHGGGEHKDEEGAGSLCTVIIIVLKDVSHNGFVVNNNRVVHYMLYNFLENLFLFYCHLILLQPEFVADFLGALFSL